MGSGFGIDFANVHNSHYNTAIRNSTRNRLDTASRKGIIGFMMNLYMPFQKIDRWMQKEGNGGYR